MPPVRTRFTRSLMGLGCLMLCACHGQLPTHPVGVAARPSATPAASQSGVVFTGSVRIDPGYLIGLGAGRLISDAGASVVSLAGGDRFLLDHQTLLTDAHGNIVSNNGSNLITRTKLTWNRAPRFSLMDAPAQAATVPVAGMGVAAVSLLDGSVLGQAIALTDASGNYRLTLPQSVALQGNIRLEARVPDSAQSQWGADARLQYLDLASVSHASDRTLDEDTSIAHRYILDCTLSRFKLLVEAGASAQVIGLLFGTQLPADQVTQIVQALNQVRQAVLDAQVSNWPADAQNTLYTQLTDWMVAAVDLDKVPLDPTLSGWTAGRSEPSAVAALTDIMRQVRTAASGRELQTLQAMPFVTAALAAERQADPSFQGTPQTVLKRPSDVGDLLVNAYLATNNTGQYEAIAEAMQALGVPASASDGADDQASRLKAACLNLIMANISAVVANKPIGPQQLGLRDACIQLIKQGKSVQPSPSPSP